MIDVAIIPARAGSKGLPGKNTRELLGRPLIAWTVEAAVASGVFRRVVVTTDGDEIATAARAAGADVPFMRPSDLAADEAGTLEVVLHALDQCGPTNSFALLQPTSPLRTKDHIIEAVGQFELARATALISTTVGKPGSWHFTVEADGTLSSVFSGSVATHRQGVSRFVSPNGAMYIYKTAAFRTNLSFIPRGCLAYQMGQIDSLDIDVLEDFQLVEAILSGGLRPSFA